MQKIYGAKGSGKTSYLIEMAYADPTIHILVADQGRKNGLIGEHPEIRDQIMQYGETVFRMHQDPAPKYWIDDVEDFINWKLADTAIVEGFTFLAHDTGEETLKEWDN